MIKFDLSLDFSSMSKEQKLAFSSFVSVMADDESAPVVAPKRAAAAKKATAPKKDIAPKAEAPKAEAPKEEVEAEETSDSTDASEITDQMVRELMQSRVATHKDAVKSKMTEFGAPNITKLKEKGKLVEFYNYLESLEDE